MVNVSEYVVNEINYIEKYDKENCKNDLKNLYSLTDKDIETIQEYVERDDELCQTINETISYYLYHYIEKKKEIELV